MAWERGYHEAEGEVWEGYREVEGKRGHHEVEEGEVWGAKHTESSNQGTNSVVLL